MAKKSNGKKRGIQRGVGKHKIQSRPTDSAAQHGKKYLDVSGIGFAELGRKCFELTFRGAEYFCLAPFTRTLNGEYVPLDLRQRTRHYVALSIVYALTLQKTWGTLEMVISEELRLETFMCISLYLVWSAPSMVCLGIWARPQEAMDLLNSWPKILSCLEEIEGETAPSPFDSNSASVKAIGLNVALQGTAVAAGLVTIIFDNLPICFLQVGNRFGLIPDGILPHFWWQLIFSPLEHFIHVAPMLCTGFTVGILVISLGVLKVYTGKLR